MARTRSTLVPSFESARFWLPAIAAASFVARLFLGRLVHDAFFFLDELGYEQTAITIARHGHVGLYNKAGLAYSPLYPVLISPIYALTSSASEAYAWVKLVNALLLSLAIVPVYGLARFVLSRGGALAVAALTAIAPLMFYSSLAVSENLAFPLFLLATLALLRTLREPSPLNDALLLAAVVLATAARIQLVVLVPIAVTAMLLVGAHERRLAQAAAAHWLFLLPIVTIATAAVVQARVRDRPLPFTGRYADVGTASASFWKVVKIAIYHLAGIDLVVGVAPFVAALVCGYLLVRGRLSPQATLFGWTAAAATFWLVVETAFDAAAYDREPYPIHTSRLVPDLPRIHERYLVYLVPLVIVTLVASLRRARRETSPAVLAAAAAIATLLPLTIPFHSVVNHAMVAESPSLQLFGRTVHGDIVPITHATTVAVVFAAIFSAVYVASMLGHYEHLAIPLTAVVFLFLSTLTGARFVAAASGSTRVSFSGPSDWVDRAADGRNAVLLSGAGVGRVALSDTAFYNPSITRLYYTCRRKFGADYGETHAAAGTGGALRADGRPLRAELAVAPVSLRLRGHVVARDPRAHLVLVEPANGVITVGPHGQAVLDSCPF